MYFPYLRGKQFELLALRELADEINEGFHFIPIIEPVKMTLTGLTTAVKKMIEKEMKFALVLNPYEEDFAFTESDLMEEIPELKQFRDAWIPAFVYKEEADVRRIKELIQKNSLNQTMVVFHQPIPIDNEKCMNLLHQSEIKYLVVSDGDSRTTMRKLFDCFEGKKFIRLDNNFKELTRNSDYGMNTDESFTEQHLFYEKDGYFGFGDYTALRKNYTVGGMLPYAIAIHLTYQKEDGVVYIHHFVSDTNDDRSNIQGKFFEAALKVKAFYEHPYEKTQAVNTLIGFIEQDRYPGLGYLKMLSIKNSIQLMNRILKSDHESLC